MSRKQKPREQIAETPPVIRDEFARVPAGRIATVITHLEMRAPPQPRTDSGGSGLQLRRVNRPELGWYRDLYRRVGENWLWFSRLALDDAALRTLIHNPTIEVHALDHGGRDEGILELDFRRWPDAEISFLGVVPALIGTGAGRFLMNRALAAAWGRHPSRVTIHTCTLDHPRALEFYLRTGFIPYARSVEIADDPRLVGLLPRTAAAHVPIVTDEHC
jgi:GNAT superfamily N-acetyltransferase